MDWPFFRKSRFDFVAIWWLVVAIFATSLIDFTRSETCSSRISEMRAHLQNDGFAFMGYGLKGTVIWMTPDLRVYEIPMTSLTIDRLDLTEVAGTISLASRWSKLAENGNFSEWQKAGKLANMISVSTARNSTEWWISQAGEEKIDLLKYLPDNSAIPRESDINFIGPQGRWITSHEEIFSFFALRPTDDQVTFEMNYLRITYPANSPTMTRQNFCLINDTTKPLGTMMMIDDQGSGNDLASNSTLVAIVRFQDQATACSGPKFTWNIHNGIVVYDRFFLFGDTAVYIFPLVSYFTFDESDIEVIVRPYAQFVTCRASPFTTVISNTTSSSKTSVTKQPPFVTGNSSGHFGNYSSERITKSSKKMTIGIISFIIIIIIILLIVWCYCKQDNQAAAAEEDRKKDDKNKKNKSSKKRKQEDKDNENKKIETGKNDNKMVKKDTPIAKKMLTGQIIDSRTSSTVRDYNTMRSVASDRDAPEKKQSQPKEKQQQQQQQLRKSKSDTSIQAKSTISKVSGKSANTTAASLYKSSVSKNNATPKMAKKTALGKNMSSIATLGNIGDGENRKKVPKTKKMKK